MRSRSREINTLNLSMLDVIAGAMAAFLILMVILLPYYERETVNQEEIMAELRQALAEARAAQSAAESAARTAQADLAAAETQRNQAALAAAEIQDIRAALASAQAEAARQEARAEGLARQLARTFLVLYVRWDTHDDVDLHLTDPSGAEFWWNGHKTLPGRPGELSEDNIVGPGNEVWEIREAPPGDYRVEVRLYQVRDTRKPVVVKGRVFHRDGSAVFPAVALAQRGQRERIATLRVDENGGVRLVP
jgi:multidrug efflux pump subunit AcrA (membrane-fusion protein)